MEEGGSGFVEMLGGREREREGGGRERRELRGYLKGDPCST